MKIEIEITEEDAACLWFNCWGKISLKDIVQDLATSKAEEFKGKFPHEVEASVAIFRKETAGRQSE